MIRSAIVKLCDLAERIDKVIELAVRADEARRTENLRQRW